MNSSQSTTSSSLLSDNDVSWEKAFFAGTCKNFMGTGPRKISKAEIKKFNISKLVNKAHYSVENSTLSFPLSSTYSLGICRIYEKSVDLLLEDLKKFNDELNAALIGDIGLKKPKPIRKSTINKVSTVEDDKFLEISNQSLEVCEEHDFMSLLQRDLETDRNRLHEIDVPKDQMNYSNTLEDFGDELHLSQNMRSLREGPSEWLSPSDEVAQLGQSIIVSHQITGGDEIHESTSAVIPHAVHQAIITETSSPRSTAPRAGRHREEDDAPNAGTPKRKARQPHDDTPTKRPRKSPSLASGHSTGNSAVRRLFEQDRQRSPMPDNTEEESSVNQNTFEHDEQILISAAQEMVLDGTDGNDAEPFTEHMPSERIIMEPRRSSTDPVHTVQNLEQDRQSIPPPTVDASEDNQLQPDQLLENISDIEVEGFNDESLTSKLPKRLRKWMERDVQKKIPLPLDINKKEIYSKVHTRPRGSTLVNPNQKESVADLLSLPATRLKTKGPCSFGKTLLNIYFERTRPTLDADDEDASARPSLPQLPRDANVNRRRPNRFSFFGRDARQRQSEPSIPGDQHITSEAGNGNNEDRDRELMPPPLTPGRPSGRLPEILVEPPPPLPELEQLQQSPQRSPHRQLPVTPNRPSIRPDTPAVSPRQSPSVPNNFQLIPGDTPDDIFDNHPALPFDARPNGDDDSDPRSHHLIGKSPSSLSMTSERERSTLMKEDAFYQFLKSQWAEMLDTVDLRSIIPRRPTPVAFFRYFVFLQRLQKQGKLTMLQTIIYGPVQIVRERTREIEE